MSKYSMLLFLVLTAVFSACNKDNYSEFTDSPVIEGYLRPGSNPEIKISRQIPFSDNVYYSDDDINFLEVELTC